jgi:hypothetical protein
MRSAAAWIFGMTTAWFGKMDPSVARLKYQLNSSRISSRLIVRSCSLLLNSDGEGNTSPNLVAPSLERTV